MKCLIHDGTYFYNYTETCTEFSVFFQIRSVFYSFMLISVLTSSTCIRTVAYMYWTMNGWMNEWMSEWMNEWMSEWMNEWMSKRVNEWVN
jgi:hypothetical protein